MRQRHKRSLRVEIYKKVLNYTCAHPECESGLNVEAHHIRPLFKGGEDKYWNLISLCWACHHKKQLHSRSESKMTELYVYKGMHEREILGFFIDEMEEGFKERWAIAIKLNRNIKDDEKFIAINLPDNK